MKAVKKAANQVSSLVLLNFFFFTMTSQNMCRMLDLKIISRKEFEKLKKEKRIEIFFGFHETLFGRCLIGLFDQWICHLSFVNKSLNSDNLEALKLQWPGCCLIKNEKLTTEIVKKVFGNDTELFKVLLKGTDFEAKVWHALVNIPKGETACYEDVAAAAGSKKAVRAVANAVAKNSVAYLVPCHRVIRKDGNLHKYRWGSRVKRTILEFEKSHC